MKVKLKSFPEGTTHVTTGDLMHEDDHRRHKAHCYFYSNGYCRNQTLGVNKCIGSAHCNHYYDNIDNSDLTDNRTYIVEKLEINNIIGELKYKINKNSIEGTIIRKIIIGQCGLNSEDIEKNKLQLERYELEKEKLIKEIRTHNNKLFFGCFLLGLLIITIPLCVSYYQNNERIEYVEVEELKNKMVNKALEEKVMIFKEKNSYYKRNVVNDDKIIVCNSDPFLLKAQLSFEEKSYNSFLSYLRKCIDNNSVSAIVWLAKIYKSNSFFIYDKWNYLILLTYASYLGDKGSRNKIVEKLQNNNFDTKFINLFKNKQN